MNRVGTYQLENDILKISFLALSMQSLEEETVLYRIFYQDVKPNTISFVPINNEHQYICIEGCAEIFERRNRIEKIEDLVIINAKLLDVKSGNIHRNQTLLISNGIIKEISTKKSIKPLKQLMQKENWLHLHL